MKHTVDFHFFPGYTRKSLTFSIDDGNVQWDTKFLGILRPHGILGTFNLCSPNLSQTSAQTYRDLYDGYEIANHVSQHPLAMQPRYEAYRYAQESFDLATAEEGVFYPSDIPGMYYTKERERRYHVADDNAYLYLTDLCTEQLRELFGEDAAAGFVWPYSEQPNEPLKRALVERGFAYMRKTGNVLNTTGYAFPSDRMAWSYNADHAHLLASAADYAAYADDGELKFFCFGVHSFDFERAGTWAELETFAEQYGDRPQEYYYASVLDLFRYEDAVRSLVVSDAGVHNPSDIDLYGVVDGERVVLKAHGTLTFDA